MIRLARWLQARMPGLAGRVPAPLRLFLMAWAAGFLFFLVLLG